MKRTPSTKDRGRTAPPARTKLYLTYPKKLVKEPTFNKKCFFFGICFFANQ